MPVINVTKTFLPPIEEYIAYLEKIWKTSWVTNNGPLLKELEEALRKELGVKHLFFVSNGTIGLQIAIKALGLTKEIITTPFSYVATTTSILWEGCKPVFVDLDKDSFCLDPKLIEKHITGNTEAILATHVYGLPCNIEEIEHIAKNHNLKVIYDSAHAFGTMYKNKPLSSYGDISVLSFHATKIFHTIEGGAILTDDDLLAEKISLFRSFGHVGEEDYFTIGINGKNSEFHAAMGLCILPRVAGFIKHRQELFGVYNKLLSDACIRPVIPEGTIYNYSYYPVLLKSESVLLKVKAELEKNNIIPRRYFYPSLNQLPYLKGEKCPVSEDFAHRVLSLPLYHELPEDDIKRIADIINKSL